MEKIYGRKVIREHIILKKVLFLMIICFLIGTLAGGLITGFNRKKPLGSTVNAIVKEEPEIKWLGDKDFKPLNVPLDEDLQEYIYYLSSSYDIDFSLVMAIIYAESNFKTDTISKTHDYGLMQINKCNHKWLSETLGITDFLDPKQNINAGVYVLSRLFEANGNDTVKVLMSYNMGETGAKRCWNKDIYSTAYTRKIIKKQLEFQEELKNE